MSAENQPENPPAFPCIEGTEGYGNVRIIVSSDGTRYFETLQSGMSLRDYFAAKAMVGILSNPASYDEKGVWRNESETIAEVAYDIANDMLKERAGE